jgi:hypothetical protein
MLKQYASILARALLVAFPAAASWRKNRRFFFTQD